MPAPPWDLDAQPPDLALLVVLVAYDKTTKVRAHLDAARRELAETWTLRRAGPPHRDARLGPAKWMREAMHDALGVLELLALNQLPVQRPPCVVESKTSMVRSRCCIPHDPPFFVMP